MTTNPGLETITLSRFIYQQLAADTQLQNLLGGTAEAGKRITEGVYAGTADRYVVYTIVPDANDVKGVGVTHVMTRAQVQVKAVAARATSYNAVIPIYQRVHAILEGRATPTEVTQGGLVLTCHRLSVIQYPEREDGVEYRHLGGLYEALVQ